MERPRARGRFSVKRQSASKHTLHPVWPVSIALTLLLVSMLNLFPAETAYAMPVRGVAADASCMTLARLDPTATNGGSWGHTILAGHNASGGWFGVDVCSNGVNSAAPNSANVSCDLRPANWSRTGCAPGGATSDGYGLTFQCVELIARFSAWAFGDSPTRWTGDAPDLWLPQNHPSDFIMYPNGSNHAPVRGDILVWGNVTSSGQPWPAGADKEHGGHIAVVAAVRDGMVITAEENVKWGSQDHPSDTLALTHSGSHWILSGSTEHTTRLPTYRWQSTMGDTRATYGWLHSVRNTGIFPSHSKAKAPLPTAPAAAPQAPHTPTPLPTQSSGALPSLTPAAVVTSGGTLADVVWSTVDAFSGEAPATTAESQPQAMTRDLGTPPGVRLTPGQRASSVIMQDGTRYTFVIGADGQLYAALTNPTLLGVIWQDLATPSGLTLSAPVVASSFSGGIEMVARASDGALWWRAGSPGAPGAWLPLGHPSGVTLSPSFTIAGQPGSGLPLLLALDTTGHLYERLWQSAVNGSDGSVAVAAGWSDWVTWRAQPTGAAFSGAMIVVPEISQTTRWIGVWPDTPLDLFMLDTQGRLWWLRASSQRSGWITHSLSTPVPFTALLSGVTVSGATSSASTATPAPSSAATTSASSSATLLQAQIYGVGATSVYVGTVAIAAPSQGNVSPPSWTTLDALPGAASNSTGGAALPVTSGESAIFIPAGEQVFVGGASKSVDALVGANARNSSNHTSARHAPWMSLGGMPIASAFSDTFTSRALDPGWYRATPDGASLASVNGLRLIPGAGRGAALLQGAAQGNTTLAVRLRLPTSHTYAWSEGLALYLDSGDWLTLLADGNGRVRLCGSAWGQTTPCQTQTLPQTLKTQQTQVIWLRITRLGASFTGAFSVDNNAWQTVGQWLPLTLKPSSTSGAGAADAVQGTPTPTPSAMPSPTASPSAVTPPPAIAALAFTTWGVLARGNAPTAEWPTLTHFTVTTTPGS